MPAPTATDIMARLDEIAATLPTIAESIASLHSKIDALATRPAPSSNSFGSASENLPNYGRAKGQPIRGAQMGDLEYYAAGCRRSLDDPGKSRWHDTERARLAAIEAEIARQTGGAVAPVGGSEPVDDLPF